MKLPTFFVSKTKQVYAKTLVVPEITFKNKSNVTLDNFRNFAYISVICKQRF